MSYQVLARKWRPQTFKDVVGQQHVLTALANGLSLGRVHHAYLFSGTRGIGKTTIARVLAKGLNCETGVTATPCGQCNSCYEAEQGRFIDLIEIDAASRTKVEDTRVLLDNVQYAPARGRFKIYLIDEVHMLSRHSFNALLKTLEEPPEYVKFLLVTTDPQKLPATILSRCLQFHLKALDQEQIRSQLERVLQAEQISAENPALQLLACAADTSMRDALSLTDQAIAMGQGQVTTSTVKDMLGTLDNEYPLALIEALVRADGKQVMELLNQTASRSAEWEALLVEMLTLLHHIAMIQILPSSSLGEDMIAIEHRLRELAHDLPPADVQLYYQTLLVGRKELVLAPSRRMGVEMTLLRALAFHPKVVIAEPTVRPTMADRLEPAATPLLDITSQLIQARKQLMRQQANNPEKNLPACQSMESVNSALGLGRLATAIECGKQSSGQEAIEANPTIKEAYRWKAVNLAQVKMEKGATPKALRGALEHEKKSELIKTLVIEAQEHDVWAAEIAQLKLPKLVQQLALNTWKEATDNRICLHLRSSQRHLNSHSAQKVLNDALNAAAGQRIELTVVEDDNPTVLTPLEWRQKIYEEKLAQARQSIITDTHIQTLRRFFNADVDEESIRPV